MALAIVSAELELINFEEFFLFSAFDESSLVRELIESR